MTKLPLSYFQGDDVVELSRDLLGKVLMTRIDGVVTGGIIMETEAYRGPEDRASHAFDNRRTARNEMMYAAGGVAYVYLCYGIHSLFNVVTNVRDVPHAILVRAISPTIGVDMMKQRRKQKLPIASGPGTLSQALGITTNHNGISLTGDQVWIEEAPEPIPGKIIAGPRVGIDYAGEDAHLPWRFQLRVRNQSTAKIAVARAWVATETPRSPSNESLVYHWITV